MSLESFISTLKTADKITLVGPLYPEQYDLDDSVIFVDGGNKARVNNIGFCVGDFDSSDIKPDEVLNQNKDFSDLSYVLNKLVNKFKNIKLLGFLGKRRDHELINLAEVHQFLKKVKKDTTCIFDNEIIAVSSGKYEFNIDGLFSLFLFEKANVRLAGECKYEIFDKTLLELSSHGLSNIGNGRITVETTGPLFILLSDL